MATLPLLCDPSFQSGVAIATAADALGAIEDLDSVRKKRVAFLANSRVDAVSRPASALRTATTNIALATLRKPSEGWR